MSEIEIESIKVIVDGETHEWSIGDVVKLNIPGNEDDGLFGDIFTFNVLANPQWDPSTSDDSGIVVPMVFLPAKARGTLFGIPFDLLMKPSPLEALAYERGEHDSLQGSPLPAKMVKVKSETDDTDDESICF